MPKNKEKVTHIRKLVIKDLSDNELTITLWGDHAIDFSTDSVYDEKIGNVIVCLFVGCIPRRDYKDYDKTYLSASSACSYYFNPAIPEAAPFYTRFKDTRISIDRPTPRAQPAAPTVAESPLKMMTVADLNAIIDPFDFEDGKYKCEVTVVSIPSDTRWWYMSCRRHKNKAIQHVDHTYRCPVCNSSDTMPSK